MVFVYLRCIPSSLNVLAIPEDTFSDLEPREQNPDVRINRKSSMIGRNALLSKYCKFCLLCASTSNGHCHVGIMSNVCAKNCSHIHYTCSSSPIFFLMIQT